MAGDDGREARIAEYAEALEWFIANPDAPLDPMLKAYVELVKRRVAEAEAGKAVAVIE